MDESKYIQQQLRRAQKTGILQLQNVNIQPYLQQIYNLDTTLVNKEDFYQNVNLKKLILKDCQITNISYEIENLQDLEYLDLTGNNLIEFPPVNLQNLKVLILDKNKIKILKIPHILNQIEYFSIKGNQLESFIFEIKNMKRLDLSENQIKYIDIDGDQLILFDCSHNRITNSCVGGNQYENQSSQNQGRIFIQSPQKIENINISFNQIQYIDLTDFQDLQILNVERNQIQNFQIRNCKKLSQCNFSGNRINVFDISIIPQQIQELEINDNQVQKVIISQNQNNYSNQNQDEQQKQIIEQLKEYKLVTLQLMNNELTEIPPELFLIKTLNRIALDGNRITRMRGIINLNGDKLRNYLKDKLPLDHYWYKMQKQNQDLASRIQENRNNTVDNGKIILNNWESIQNLQNQQISEVTIKDLVLTQEQMDQMIDILQQLTKLQKLTLYNIKQAEEIYISDFQYLRQIEINKVEASYIQIQQCQQLTQIQIQCCYKPDIVLYSLNKLQLLMLNDNSLQQIPKSVYQFTNLIQLNLQNNQIQTISDTIRKMNKLQVLNLSNNNIRMLNYNIGYLTNLQQLNLQGNSIIRPSQSILNRSLDQILSFLRGE